MGPFGPDERIRDYVILNLVLAFVHIMCSVWVLVSDPENNFEVPLVFSYNAWRPVDGADATCSGGCQLSEERSPLGTVNVTVIIAFFGFISGANHLVQYIAGLCGVLEGWLESGRIAALRNLDYAFSASLMLVVVVILFIAPTDIQLLTYAFGFQSLIQLAGYAAERIKECELRTCTGADHSAGLTVFYSAVAYFVLAWALYFYLFYVAGYTEHETTTVAGQAPGGTTEPATPPAQVQIFLYYIVASFSLFPINLFFKLNYEPDNEKKPNLFFWQYKYEIYFCVLSFLAKIPLQSFFALGAFNRERITAIGEEVPDLSGSEDDFNARVIVGAAVPFAVVSVFGNGALYAFRKDLGLNCRKVAVRAGAIFAVLALLGVAIYVPVFVEMGAEPGTAAGLHYNALSVAVALAVCAAAQWIYARTRDKTDYSNL